MQNCEDMIKAVVFDLGGVLLDLDMEKCKEAFREKAGFTTIDQYIDTFHQKGFWGELEGGTIGAEEFIGKCIENSRPGTTKDTVLDCFREFLEGIPAEKVDFLKELSGKYPLYLLSNTNPVAMDICKEIFSDAGFSPEEVFTKQFLSYEMKLMKPSPEIYRKAIEEIAFPADEILFIDDSQTNLEAAAREGIQTLHYIPGTDLRKAVMDRLGCQKD